MAPRGSRWCLKGPSFSAISAALAARSPANQPSGSDCSSAQCMIARLWSSTVPSGSTSTGTVPLAEAASSSGGFAASATSRSSSSSQLVGMLARWRMGGSRGGRPGSSSARALAGRVRWPWISTPSRRRCRAPSPQRPSTCAQYRRQWPQRGSVSRCCRRPLAVSSSKPSLSASSRPAAYTPGLSMWSARQPQAEPGSGVNWLSTP